MIQRSNQWFAVAILLGYLAFLAYYVLGNPLFTWDTVPYVATVLASETSDLSLIHANTYSYLQQNLSPDQFNSLISGPYAADLYANTEHFASQLNMYKIKPAYVAFARALTIIGIDPLDALLLLSLIPGMMICAIVFIWLSHYLNPLQAIAITVLFSIAARLIDLSRVPVPDNLSSLVVIAGLYTLIARRWLYLATFLLCFSILVRTNNILFVGLLLLWQSWTTYSVHSSIKDKEFMVFSSGFLISCIAYLIVSQVYDYQWWRLFYHTFIESQTDIDAFAVGFSPNLYLNTIKEAVRQLIASGAFIATSLPVFLVLFFLAFPNDLKPFIKELISPKQPISFLHITTLCIPVFAAFLLLFPLAIGWDRFFLPYYTLILVFSAHVYSRNS